MSAHNFQYETVALARECDSFVEGSDWSRSTFSSLYRRVQEHMAGQYGRGHGLYRYKNATLVDQLRITPEEERHMKTLISRSEKDRRWNDRRRDPRREARGFEKRREERTRKIVELRRLGMSTRQIAVLAGCDHSTVVRTLRKSLATAIDSLT